jgi:anti-sigma B factor antagonist
MPRDGRLRRRFNLLLTLQSKCGNYNPRMPELPLRIATLPSSIPGHRILKLDGPLILSNFFEFQDLVRADRVADLIIDCSGVPYIDSAGIGSLVNGYVSHQHAGKTLSLVGVTERVRTSLRIAKVEQFFPIFSSVAEAEQGVGN